MCDEKKSANPMPSVSAKATRTTFGRSCYSTFFILVYFYFSGDLLLLFLRYLHVLLVCFAFARSGGSLVCTNLLKLTSFSYF